MDSSDDGASRHERLTLLFAAASELAPEQRAAFLERECDDAAMRAELDELLSGAERPLSVLDDADSPERRGGFVAMLARADERWIGRDIGEFRVVAFLGAGGMGAVFRARQTSPPRDVAIKLLHGGSFDERALRRFEVETQLLGRLSHPGVAKVFSAGVHEEGALRIPYCVLELVEGGEPITTFARARRFGVRQKLEQFLQACDALQHAHERGVIHRDVKPENLLVDGAGNVRVIDFGIARVLSGHADHDSLTRTGHLLGTLAYMSPEQLDPKREEVDTRADVYSLGVVLYELLVERLPIAVEGGSLIEISRRILEDEPAKLSTLERGLRGDLETIVAKALAKDPARRYSSAGALAADLRAFLDEEPIAARPATALYQMTKFARRHRGLVGGGLVAALALVVGSAIAFVNAARAVQARDEARQLAYDASLSAAASSLNAFEIDTARRRLDAAPPELRGWEWGHLASRLDDASFAVGAPASNIPPFGVRDFAFVRGENGQEELAVATIAEHESGEVVELLRVDPKNGRTIARFEFGPLLDASAAIGVDRLWCVSRGGRIDQHQLSDGAQLRSVAAFPAGSAPSRYQIAILDESRCLLKRRDGEESYIVDLERGTCAPPPPLPESDPIAQLRAPTLDGTGLISLRRKVCFTPFDERAPNICFEAHGEPFVAFTQHPDGVRVFAGCQDGQLVVIRRESDHFEIERRLSAHDDAVTAACVTHDGQFLATGSRDRVVRVWRCDTLELVTTLAGAEAAVAQLAFSSDGRTLAVGGGARGVQLFDEATRADPHVLSGSGSYVYCVALSPDERWIASGDWRGQLRLWDRESGVAFAELDLGRSDAPFRTLEWSDDGRTLIVGVQPGAGSRELQILDLESGRVRVVLPSHDGGGGRTCAWLDASTFAVVQTQTIEIRSGVDGSLVRRFDPAPDQPDARHWSLRCEAARSPDGRELAVTQADGALRIWSIADGRYQRTIPAHLGVVFCVAWSPHGEWIASGGVDRRVVVSDARDGSLVAELLGHASGVYSVVFSSDLSRLFSGADDQTIRVWSTSSWTESVRLVGHDDYVFDLAHASDGELVSASGDRTLRLWGERTRSARLQAIRERDALVAKLSPLVSEWCATAEIAAVRARIRSAPDLTDRERDVAAQLVLERAFAAR